MFIRNSSVFPQEDGVQLSSATGGCYPGGLIPGRRGGTPGSATRATHAAVSVSVRFVSCPGRDYGDGSTTSRYDDQDGEFPEAARTQERLDWHRQSRDSGKGKQLLEAKPGRPCLSDLNWNLLNTASCSCCEATGRPLDHDSVTQKLCVRRR